MKISELVFKLQSGQDYMITINNIQKAVTPDVEKAELWF